MERPEFNNIITSELLEGFDWILSISDRLVFYASNSVKDSMVTTPSRIDTIPIISISSHDAIISNINKEIDDKLSFEVDTVVSLTDNQIIECVVKSVGLIETEDEELEFTIIPREIELESPYTPQPVYEDIPPTKVTEAKPTSPPRGYIPIFIRKIGTESSGGQWWWNGNQWVEK